MPKDVLEIFSTLIKNSIGCLFRSRSLVSFQGHNLIIGHILLAMPCYILDAVVIKNKVVLVLDPNPFLKSSFRNLIALSQYGVLLWEAEFPRSEDYYYWISSNNPLRVYSFSSFECEIDCEDGKIKSTTFFK